MDLIIFIALLVIAYISGTIVEKNHLKKLDEREANLPKVPVITYDRKSFDKDVQEVKLISANTVIGADFFKTYLSGLVNFFGGNISVLESVLQRARREAVVRVKEMAKDADYIADLRYETTEISSRRRESLKVEIYAYATAIYLKK